MNSNRVSVWSAMARLAAAVVCVSVLSGCSSIGSALGFSKRPPDEFEVLAKAPLVVPPDYNLRPPAEEDQGLREKNPREMAFKALFPPKPKTAMPAVPAGSVGTAPVSEQQGGGVSPSDMFSDEISTGNNGN